MGAYALHDFFLYHMMDSGASRSSSTHWPRPRLTDNMPTTRFSPPCARSSAASSPSSSSAPPCRTARRSVRSAFPPRRLAHALGRAEHPLDAGRSSSSNASTPETGARNCRQAPCTFAQLCYHFLNYIGRTFAFRPAAYRRRIFSCCLKERRRS